MHVTEGSEFDFKFFIFSCIVVITCKGISSAVALRWMAGHYWWFVNISSTGTKPLPDPIWPRFTMPYDITRAQAVKSLSHLNHCMSHQDVQPFIISVMTISSCQIQLHRIDVWKWKCIVSFRSSMLITQNAVWNGWWDLGRSGPHLYMKMVFQVWGNLHRKDKIVLRWSYLCNGNP